MICKTCGDDMYGDGYSISYRCISAENWEYSAPDEGPFYCTEEHARRLKNREQSSPQHSNIFKTEEH